MRAHTQAKAIFLATLMVLMAQVGFIEQFNSISSEKETRLPDEISVSNSGSGTVFTGNGTQWQPSGMVNSTLFPVAGSWDGSMLQNAAIHPISDDMAIFRTGTGTGNSIGCFSAYSHTNYSTWHIYGDSNYNYSMCYDGSSVTYGPTIGSITYLGFGVSNAPGMNNNAAQLFAYNRTNDTIYLVAELNAALGPDDFHMIAINSTIYMGSVMADSTDGKELWAYETTNDTLWQVADINPGASSSSPKMLLHVGSSLLFVANGGGGYQLWVHEPTNGTTWAASTASGSSANPVNGHMSSKSAAILGSRLMFYGSDSAGERELWAYETSNHTLWQAADINTQVHPSGISSSHCGNHFTRDGTRMYFCADNASSGKELWAYESTNDSVWLLAETYTGSSGNPPQGRDGSPAHIAVMGDLLVYDAVTGNQSGNNGRDLYVYNLTNNTGWKRADFNADDSSGHVKIIGVTGSQILIQAEEKGFINETSDEGMSLFVYETSNDTIWWAGRLGLTENKSLAVTVGGVLNFGTEVLFTLRCYAASSGWQYSIYNCPNNVSSSQDYQMWAYTPANVTIPDDFTPSGGHDLAPPTGGFGPPWAGAGGDGGGSGSGSGGGLSLSPASTTVVLTNNTAMTPITYNWVGSSSGTTSYNGNGTVWQVADIRSGSSSSPGFGGMEILVGDTLYFSANDGSTGHELWAHDTSNSSTWQVADINNGTAISFPGSEMVILVGDTIYFDANDGTTGRELWAHDTSNSSTWQVANINSGSFDSNPGSLMEILVGDTIYFNANDGTIGREIWAHDTSNSSTWQVTDINSGVGSSDPGSEMAILVGDTIYFDAQDGITGHEIWAHDTSNSSTWQVADINSGWATSDSGGGMEILVGDTIYFDADDGSTGHELWAHDTSNSSTWLAADINSGGSNSNSYPGNAILVGDTIYFEADGGSTGDELWAHDTSNSSTWLVADLYSGGGNSDPGYYIAILVGDTIYFDAKDGSKGVQKDVWAHDTSNSSTWKVSDIGNGTSTTSGARPGSDMAILVGDIIYFNADDYPGTNRNELWAHDTSNGTTWQVYDISSAGNAGPGHSMAILVGDTLYFDASDGSTGTELWAFGSGNGASGPSAGPVTNANCEISPTLPAGLTLTQGTCTISGTPTVVQNITTYTVWVNESGVSATATVDISVISEDSDGDGYPDIIDAFPNDPSEWMDTDGDGIGNNADPDDDNDGYADVVETNTGTYSGMNDTGTDPLNPDTDGNGICDGPNDVPPICTAGPDRDPPTNVVGVIDIAIEMVEPYLIFPGMTYTISPGLPASLVLDNSTGILSGTAFSPLANTTFTVSCLLSDGTSYSWQFSIEILDDSDGDGLPNELPVDYPIGGELVEDTDDDNDGLNDTTELGIGTSTTNPDTDGDGICDGPIAIINGTNGVTCYAGPDPYPLDPNAPIDTDGDGLPDENDGWTGPPMADEDDDNDGYPDVSEIACGSDPLNASSIPDDMDGDAICDGDDDDMDGDGIDNVNETGNTTTEGTLPDNPDTDGDGVCDGPNSPNTTFNNFTNCIPGPDDFPLDPSAWLDTDGDGDPDDVVGNSTSVPPLVEDDDDDNDGWNDTAESDCLTDSKDALDVPADLNDDGLCDVNDDDWDDDGVSNDDETNTSLMDTDPWNPDTDGDGICDGPIAFEGLCHAGPDPYPLDPNAPIDTDDDGLPDENDGWTGPPIEDDDDDNDGTLDVEDDFPLDDGADTDTDGDGDPDNLLYHPYDGPLVVDEDDDNDGWNDTAEIECGTEPLNASSVPVDDNENGICDALDPITETESEDDEDLDDSTENLSIFSMWSCCILLLIILLIFALLYRQSDEDEEGKDTFVVMNLDDAFDEEVEDEIEEVVEPTKNKDEEYDEIYGADDDAAISEKQAKLAELDAELAAKEAEIAALASTPAAVDFATIGVATASDKDDLTQIKGIGPALQGKLNDAGIFTLSQLSKVTPEIEKQIDDAIGYFPGRLSREKVFDQARELLKR